MKAKKKRWLFVLVILFIIVLVVVISFFYVKKVPKYSDDPKTWVEEKEGNINKINIEKATEGKGYFNVNNQQYKSLSINTAFGYDGLYQGFIFKNKYYDENGRLLMEITQELVPNDNILQGIIIEKFDDGKPFTYIFLDEDWKKQFPSINVAWGKNYQNFKKFDFKKVIEGVYMDWVEDDFERFNFDLGITQGGVMVGNIVNGGVGVLGVGNATVLALH